MGDVDRRLRAAFLILWLSVQLIKCGLAARLPLFADEVFFWQEGQYPALAYSDVPGMTAWLARLGDMAGMPGTWGLRWPFLVIGALVPWLVVGITARWFGWRHAWQVGILAVTMPLSGSLGLLAVPDVPLALAALLCLHAGALLLERVTAGRVALLALGLALGAMCHYRFIAVMGMGLAALLFLPRGRALLLDARVWMAVSLGVVAWLPLLAWNAEQIDSGLRYQLLERQQWELHWEGLRFLLIQCFAVSPLLMVLMVMAVRQALRGSSGSIQQRYFALVGCLSIGVVFALGFVTDVDRVSLHWPLPGLMALLVLVPGVLDRWPRWAVCLAWGAQILALMLLLVYLALSTSPERRAAAAHTSLYPRTFTDWYRLARPVRSAMQTLPQDTVLVADNYKVGAGLGFVMDRADIAVLPHPLNDKHVRTVQLSRWSLLGVPAEDRHRLLVVMPGAVRLRDLPERYRQLCHWFGPLPAPTTVQLDHGKQRLLLFALPPGRRGGPCVTPAMAWVDGPVRGQVVGSQLDVTGWAFKDGVGLSGVTLLINGQPQGVADYGHRMDVRSYWPGSDDPNHPDVGFSGRIDVSTLPSGVHWLGLRLHGRDGSEEIWPAQPFHRQQ